MKAALPFLFNAEAATIVNIASVSALMPMPGTITDVHRTLAALSHNVQRSLLLLMLATVVLLMVSP